MLETSLMVELQRVGHFRELVVGESDGLSLTECVRDTPHPSEENILRYLNAGVPFVAAATREGDVLHPEKDYCVTVVVCTDGKWAWPGSLGYYVENYHIELPVQFIEYMERMNWTIPDLTDDELAAFEPD